jgi:hypothetical protein
MSFWDTLFGGGGAGHRGQDPHRGRVATGRSGSSSSSSRGLPNDRAASARARGNRGVRGNAPRAGGGGWDVDAYINSLLDQYGSGGGGGGGGWGGGGGGGGDGGLGAALAAALGQYNDTDAKLGDLYGDLAKTYEPMAGQTKQRYDQAIEGAKKGTEKIVAENRQRVDQETAAAAAAAQRMGIGGNAVADEARKESEYANSQLQLQQGDWGGLMGTAREAQVGRDNANLQGARDAGTIAREELRKQYEEYVAGLRATIRPSGGGGGGGRSGGGGGGGGGSRTGNKLLDKMNEAMLVYALGKGKGVYTSAWAFDAYGPEKQRGAAALGVSPAQYNSAARAFAQGGTSSGARYIQGGGSPTLAEHFAKFM